VKAIGGVELDADATGLQMSIYDLRYTPRSWRPSEPYMTFQGAYASDRFGLGFDYDPSLGLVATGTYLSSKHTASPSQSPLEFVAWCSHNARDKKETTPVSPSTHFLSPPFRLSLHLRLFS
jgi:hypothetical protein